MPLSRVVHLAQRIVVGGLLLAAIAVMITGVVLRYVMVPLTDALDLDTVSFFWVEETGELLQTYLALIGGAVAIVEGGHFMINVLVHRLPARARALVHAFNCVVIALFGGLLAWQGCRLVALNGSLGTPALGISLGWFYAAPVVGGVLLVFYALRTAAHPAAGPRSVRVE